MRASRFCAIGLPCIAALRKSAAARASSLLVPVPLNSAIAVYEDACRRGHATACASLSAVFVTGYPDGQGKDPPRARAPAEKGCSLGDLSGCVMLGTLLWQGSGAPRDEPRAAALFRKAAMQGSPIAQNRLARIYAFGRGVPAPDPVQAIKWHLIAKAGGNGDLYLDDYMQKQIPENRAAGEQAAKPWLDILSASRPQ